METFPVGTSVNFLVSAQDANGQSVAFVADDVLSVESSDDTIATVSINGDGTGAVQGVAVGTVTITVTDNVTSSGAVITADTQAEVTAAAPVTSRVATMEITFS